MHKHEHGGGPASKQEGVEHTHIGHYMSIFALDAISSLHSEVCFSEGF